MTNDDKIEEEKLQCNINREAAKLSTFKNWGKNKKKRFKI